MAEERLDPAAQEIVETAWKSLLRKRIDNTEAKRQSWTDHEADYGLLKDVDAINTLIAPYLLAPTSFVDPPLSYDEIEQNTLLLLEQVTRTSHERFHGFAAEPYPYVKIDVDFVDSAAAFIQLVCNIVELSAALKRPLSSNLSDAAADVLRSACAFLLEAKVEDRNGVRWQGIAEETDPPGRYSNLFFTHAAALALHRAVNNATVARWLGAERLEATNAALEFVPTWVANQYDSDMKSFWMDAARGINQPVGTLYALEILYKLADPLPDRARDNCREALQRLSKRVTDVKSASALQTDFFHILPLPGGTGTIYYDDRKYIGAFLSVFSDIKAVDPSIISDDVVRASEAIFAGVSTEWIDEPSNLWDDGRPLICYTQDALIGLIKYTLQGAMGTVSLREDQLRRALGAALQSEDVIELLVAALLREAQLQHDRDFESRLTDAKP
ncbi:MAG TPA: hypothetical protein VGF48_02490 [Thermoanaerobaculia bacterium]|jgi:hypothetical protein